MTVSIKFLPRLCMLLASFVWALGGCASIPTHKPIPPEVNLVGLRVVELGLFEQRYELQLRVQNPNSFVLPISGMSYSPELNGEEFARGVSRGKVSLVGRAIDILFEHVDEIRIDPVLNN